MKVDPAAAFVALFEALGKEIENDKSMIGILIKAFFIPIIVFLHFLPFIMILAILSAIFN